MKIKLNLGFALSEAQKKVLLVFLFLFVALTLPVGLGYADNGSNLTLSNFPEALASKLSISVFAGGLLASLILTMIFMLPVAIWSKRLYPPLITGLVCFGMSIVFGWLDYWFLLIVAMAVALMFGSKIAGKTED